MIYNLIGRLTVKLAVGFIRRRVDPGTAAVVGAGVLAGIAAIGIAGYIATRDVPEA
ncbi:MAG: hypothetical protein WD181_02355 [Solirubrobacterales bacterium]